MLDIIFYKKQNNDNFVPCTIELCDEDYKKLIVSNFAKRFHSEKQCLIVEEEEYSIDAVYCDALVLEEAKEICNRLLFEELEKVQNYCSKIEGETINKSKLNFMFVLRDVLSSLGECQYFSYVWNKGVLYKRTIGIDRTLWARDTSCPKGKKMGARYRKIGIYGFQMGDRNASFR